MHQPPSPWPFEPSEPPADTRREQATAWTQDVELWPAVHRLSEWQAPQPSPADTRRLLAALAPALPAYTSFVRQAIQAHCQRPLASLLMIARGQLRLLGLRFWLVNILVILASAVLLWGKLLPDQALVLCVSSPALSSLGLLLAFRGRGRRVLELELASLPSPLTLTATRLGLILASDLILGLVPVLFLWAKESGQPLVLLLAWWMPLLLVSGLAMLLLLRFSSQQASTLAYGSWLACVVGSIISNLQGLLLAPAVLILSGCSGLALLIFALRRFHSNLPALFSASQSCTHLCERRGADRRLVADLALFSTLRAEPVRTRAQIRSGASTGTEHARSLLRVITWELRRVRTSRLFWLQISGLSLCMLLTLWIMGTPAQSGLQELLALLPTLLIYLILLLPFLTADSVTRDRQRRTHELLLVSPLPTWISVWGRYLASLLISLGLALLLLICVLAREGLLSLTVANHPLPQLGGVLLLWAGMVVPATFLVNNCSFALSTMLPGFSLLIKFGLGGIWLAGALVLPRVAGDPTLLPTWYGNWDPTSVITAQKLLVTFSLYFGQHFSPAAYREIALFLRNQVPDPAGWFIPHLWLAGLSLSLVLIATLVFQHMRHTYTRSPGLWARTRERDG